jgi:hypothetical protein
VVKDTVEVRDMEASELVVLVIEKEKAKKK